MMSEARKTVIKNLLEADVDFMALATGGVHTAVEISRQDTPGAFDGNGEIRPCCLIKTETTTPTGPFTHSSRSFVVLIFYQRRGYDAIAAMRERAYALLHDQCVGGLNAWSVQLADDSADLEDPATQWSLLFSRYELIVDRTPA
ncbi:MAG: hypothetical protein GY803_07005 [Chloroflexi bacterium]|nr:hypothetical protein [Chloroflexota bacterium]